MPKSYFIASYPRSGNTWVRVFLFELFKRLERIPAAAELRDLDRFMPWDASPLAVQMATGRRPSELLPREIMAKRAEVQRWIASSFGEIPVVKSHTLFGSAGGHPTFDLPSMRGALYLVRNPLDVAASLARLRGISIDQAIGILNKPLYAQRISGSVPELWGSWAENVASWTSRSALKSILVVKYEDLLADPVETFGRIVRHMGLEVSNQLIEAAAADSQVGLLQAKERAGVVRNPSPQPGFFGGGFRTAFQEKLTPPQAKAIVDRARPLMHRFGYLKPALEFIATVTA